jgi:hypothetical protein
MKAESPLTELLTALDLAKTRVPDWESLASDETVMSQVMELEYQLKPLSEHIGVDRELLPTPEELENDEIKLVVDRILEVWAEYHYFADLPQGMPIRVAYEALLSVWDDVVPSTPAGEFHFDFYDEDFDEFEDDEE